MANIGDRNTAPAELSYQEALTHLQAERMEDAVTSLRRAAASDPNHADAWTVLGLTMEALGNPREALECYCAATVAARGTHSNGPLMSA